MSDRGRGHSFLLGFILLVVTAAQPVGAVELPTDFVDELVGYGLIQPVNFDFLPDGRILLVERTTAHIRLVLPGVGTLSDPVGTVPDVGVANGEQGLLGIAVDPRWPVAPYLYVQHTSASTQNIKVVRFEATGDLDFTGDGALSLDFNLSEAYSPVYYQSVLGVPIPVWVFALVAIGGAVILNRTAYGLHVQAIGSNEQVARYAAIRVDRAKVLTYLLLGVCVAIATVLYVPRLGSATPTTGILWELEAIAAVVVGGTSLRGGAGRVTGTVIGAILLSVIGNILNLTSIISVYLNAAVQGVVIIAVAYLQRGRR